MFRTVCLAGLMVFAQYAGRAAAAPTKPRPRPTPGAALFTNDLLRTFKIEVAEPALGTLKKDNRSYVRATVTEGGRVFKDVGVHLKGNGSFQPLDQKPSFAVKFDKYTPDQDYLGLTKIMLNNSSQDGTRLGELMATQMFRDAGVPAARVTHAFVEFNGRPLGVYVLIEAMNKEFLKQYFKSPKGNLYETYLADIDSRMDQDGGTDTSQADVKKLLEVCRLADPAERWQRLPSVLDVDRYLSHAVVEIFTSHTDGYAMNRNNFRLYHDPDTDKFTFITHGLDWAFQNTGISIRPPMNSIVTRAVLQTPDGRRRFKERFAQLFTNIFQVDVLTNRVNAVVARLKAAAPDAKRAKEFEGWAAEMRQRLAARHQNIAEQLAAPEPVPLKFGADGIARLEGWRTKLDSGNPKHEQVKDGERPTLRIQSGGAPCIASWRTRVALNAGKYRFTGQARCAGVDPQSNETGSGAGLRISGGKRRNKLTGDADWTALEDEFVVEIDGDEVELVCELRANRGEVWFDAPSLRLLRK